MEFEKIEKPALIGCLCCAGNVKKSLPKSYVLDVGFGHVELVIDGKLLWQEFESDMTVENLEKQFDQEIFEGDVITLWFNRPLRDDTYRFDKYDGQWHLIKQGIGFA